MKEQEFDIQVRKLLASAEEPVSPGVWDAVEAGLDRRKRVVPVWIWRSVAAVAAAAAVVAGVFLFRPASEPALSPVSRPVAVVSEPQAVLATPAVAPVGREARAVRKLSASVVEPVETPEIASSVLHKKAPALAMPPKSSYVAMVDDHTLLNRLAYAEQNAGDGRGWSLVAAGHIQSNSRGNLQGEAGRRAGASSLRSDVEGIYNPGPDRFSMPFSLGISTKFNFTSRWAVGVGLRYTNLSRAFQGDYNSGDGYTITGAEIDNAQHWLGIPLQFYFDIVNRGRWRVHTYAGGAAEYLLDNLYTVHNAPKDVFYHEPGTYFQWSAGAGLGVEFKITPHVGIFLDPSIRYYFNSANQPRSIRTIQPLRFDMEGGVRFSFGRF